MDVQSWREVISLPAGEGGKGRQLASGKGEARGDKREIGGKGWEGGQLKGKRSVRSCNAPLAPKHPFLPLKAREAYSTLIPFNAASRIQNLTFNLERFNNYIYIMITIVINSVAAHGLQQAASRGASLRRAHPGQPPCQCQQPTG